MSVQPRRHLVKALTWSVTAFTITFLVGLAITGEWKLGLGVAMVDRTLKFVAYYLHERTWYRTKWGITHESDSFP